MGGVEKKKIFGCEKICFQGHILRAAQVRMLSSLISSVPTAKQVIISHKCDT
jgi:hypothetical protein